MTPLSPRIGLAVIASPYEVGAEKAVTLGKEAVNTLVSSGLQVLPCKDVIDSDEDAITGAKEMARADIDAMCLLYATYADDTYATTILRRTDLPAILWSTNDYDAGSIAGSQQLSAVLVEEGRYYKMIYGKSSGINDDPVAIQEISRIARAAAAKRRLVDARFGVVGYPRIKGQTQAAFDEVELRKKTGVRVVGVGTHFFTSYMERFNDDKVQATWKRVSTGIENVHVNQQQIEEGVRAYLALKRIVEENKLDAVAFEDWNNFIGIPNLAFSLLNEEGIPSACEGDVHSAITLHLLALLTGKPSFHGELLGILEEEDALLIAHYGAGAPSLAASRSEIRLEPDRASGRGVSLVYNVRPGPVTIASLTGRRGTYRMLIASGESIKPNKQQEVFHGGIVANVRFKVRYDEFLRKAQGMSHHWMVGFGDVSAELFEYCEMSGIKPVLV